MYKSRLRIICSVLVMIVTLSMATTGCNNTQKGGSVQSKASESSTRAGENTESQKKVSGNLRVAVYQVPVEDSIDPVTGSSVKGYNALFEEFLKKYPDVKIDAVSVPLDSWTAKFQALLLSNDVDVLLGSIYDFYVQGLILNLNDMAEKDKVWDLYLPTIKNAARVSPGQGHIMGLPADIDIASLAYDKKVFEDFGVEPLSMTPTIAELKEKLPKVTGKNPKTGEQCYGLYINGKWQSIYSLDILNDGFSLEDKPGAYMLDRSKTVFNINTPENKQRLLNWFEYLKYCPPGFLTGAGMENWGRDNNNVAVVLYCQPQQMEEALKNKLTDRYVVTDGIVDKDGKVLLSSAMTWCIAKSTSNVDAAWELVKYVAGYEGQKFRYENYNYIPSLKNSDFIDDSENPYVKHFINAARETRQVEFVPFVAQTFRPWLNTLMARTVDNSAIDLDKEIAEQQQKAEAWAKEQKPVSVE